MEEISPMYRKTIKRSSSKSISNRLGNKQKTFLILWHGNQMLRYLFNHATGSESDPWKDNRSNTHSYLEMVKMRLWGCTTLLIRPSSGKVIMSRSRGQNCGLLTSCFGNPSFLVPWVRVRVLQLKKRTLHYLSSGIGLKGTIQLSLEENS